MDAQHPMRQSLVGAEFNQPTRQAVGRGAAIDPANRYLRQHVELDLETHSEDDLSQEPRKIATQFFPDNSRSLLVENNSPDVGFRWSINPYRGCEHGCAYCYARPSHETLGFSAGVDFETKIMVKHAAPALLRSELAAPRWTGEFIALSGNTDCYQPAERRFRLTRGLVEVALEARQCLGIITKNALVCRDLDLLAEMAVLRLVNVSVSVTTLDAALARALEPRTSPPAVRLEAIRRLAEAGIPTQVLVAPMIPGLNDEEVPAVLEAAAVHGAHSASYTLLRLPLAVRPIFLDWLARNAPLRASKIEALIRETRNGRLNNSTFGRRHRGTGAYAQQLRQNFTVFRRKFGLDRPLPELDFAQFRPPQLPGEQLRLF